ncbi:hypothetical protein [Streptomyces sioyaensis]|uniref:hypothetical protein n=1 Tax=Streptomyces sioyaensis TaxID=67364 RepID=UPI0037A63FB5
MSDSTQPSQPPSLTQVAQMSQVLSETISHPAFAEMVRQIEAVPPGDRMAVAKAIATSEELANRGVIMPDGFRITTRYFEDPASPLKADAVIEQGDQPTAKMMAGATLCATLGGYIACISVGKVLS